MAAFAQRRGSLGAFIALIWIGCVLVACQKPQLQPTQEEAELFVQRAKDDDRSAFREWTVRCGKKYLNSQAKQVAFTLFQERVKIAAEVNANAEWTYYTSMNCLSDEPLPTPGRAARAAKNTLRGTSATAPVSTISGRTGFQKPAQVLYTSKDRVAGYTDGTVQCPTEMDWRQLGAVTGVKNQGDFCATCWAFAATGAMEGAHFITNGKLLDLADSQLVDCVYPRDTSSGSGTCPPGFTDDAFKYVMRAGGIAAGVDYGDGGYLPQQQACTADSTEAAVQLLGYNDVPEMDEQILKQVVCNQPVAVSLTVNTAFLLYAGGVFNPSATACFPGATFINHALLVVGYGTDAATGQDYWLLKNSWGTGWGEQGYMRMKRGANTCGIVTYPPTYPTAKGANPPIVVQQPPSTPAPDTEPSCPEWYTLRSGDNLIKVAEKFKVNLLKLWSVNPHIANADSTNPGDVVAIPCPPARNCAKKVLVKSGDTLGSIGRQNGVKVQSLMDANPQINNPDIINAGEVLFVPPCSAPPEVAAVTTAKDSCNPTTYTAVEGDYLGLVAAAHNMNIGDLLNLNPMLMEDSTLTAGQVLDVLLCPKALRPPWSSGLACRQQLLAAAGQTPAQVLSRAWYPQPPEADYRLANSLPPLPTVYYFPYSMYTCVPYCCAPSCPQPLNSACQ